MTRAGWSLLFVLCLSSVAAAAEESVDQLGWMSGRWQGTFEGAPFEAYYTGTEGGMMLGVSKQLHDGRVSLFELEKFFDRDGQVILLPHPFGRASKDEFYLVEFDPKVERAKFISPEHDFPTELIYERTPEGLKIIAAGDQDGERGEAVALLAPVD